MDPAMAAMMGFGGFGTTKVRPPYHGQRMSVCLAIADVSRGKASGSTRREQSTSTSRGHGDST
jgi:hypothetical protein